MAICSQRSTLAIWRSYSLPSQCLLGLRDQLEMVKHQIVEADR